MLTCPNCGSTLELALRAAGGASRSTVHSDLTSLEHSPNTSVDFILAGRGYTLVREDIHGAARSSYPSTIVKYSVYLPDFEGNERRFPIKQVVRQALQTRYSERFVEENFTAHRARDILRRLGFEVLER